MNATWTMAMIALALPGITGSAFAQSTGDTLPPARNALYVELSTVVLWGSLSVNYEHMLNDNLSLRAGINGSYYIAVVETVHKSVGGVVMVNYLTGGDHKLEVGAGVGYSLPHTDPRGNINPTPTAAIGYRYQPAHAGNIFRIGLTYDYRYSYPLQISWGRTF